MWQFGYVRVLVDHPERISDTCIHVLENKAGGIILQDPKGNEIWRGHFSDSIAFDGYAISVEKVKEVEFGWRLGGARTAAYSTIAQPPPSATYPFSKQSFSVVF